MDMVEISFSDLMSGDRKRTMPVVVQGLGVLTVTELTALESRQVLEGSAAVPKNDNEQNSLYVARVAYRLLSGRFPDSDSEIESLRGRLSPAVLMQVYTEGLEFNLISHDAKEAIEKNS